MEEGKEAPSRRNSLLLLKKPQLEQPNFHALSPTYFLPRAASIYPKARIYKAAYRT